MSLNRYDRERGHSLVPTQDELSRIPKLYETEETPTDEKVIFVKYFVGRATWWISEISRDDWMMFGYCDLGIGLPEWGYVSLYELAEGRFHNPQGLPMYVEKDLHWIPATVAELGFGRND